MGFLLGTACGAVMLLFVDYYDRTSAAWRWAILLTGLNMIAGYVAGLRDGRERDPS